MMCAQLRLKKFNLLHTQYQLTSTGLKNLKNKRRSVRLFAPKIRNDNEHFPRPLTASGARPHCRRLLKHVKTLSSISSQLELSDNSLKVDPFPPCPVL